MKKQYFINANIIDPFNSLNENGGLIISEDGKIEAIGKKVNSNNLPTREKPIDLKGKYIFPSGRALPRLRQPPDRLARVRPGSGLGRA